MGLKMGKVFGRRVLVQPIEPFTEMQDVEKRGLLYIPDKVKDTNMPMPTTGIVLKLGDDLIKWEEKPDGRLISYCGLNEGDAVMFGKYAGTEATIDKVTYRILLFEEIMCTLEVTNEEAYAVTTD